MKLGKYQHYKWWLYEVIWVAKHSETLEDLVIYKALYDSPEFWSNALRVRPKAMFEEKIIVDPAKDGTSGKEVERFAYIGE